MEEVATCNIPRQMSALVIQSGGGVIFPVTASHSPAYPIRLWAAPIKRTAQGGISSNRTPEIMPTLPAQPRSEASAERPET